MPLETVKLSELSTTCGTQMRVEMDDRSAEDYGALMQEGVALGADDPVTVVELIEPEGGMDAGTKILAHGFHRVKGAMSVGIKKMMVRVVEGQIATARAIAIEANSRHGVRQTREDIRKKIFAALQHADYKDLSSHELGRRVGCTHVTILNVKKELDALAQQAAALERGEKPRESTDPVVNRRTGEEDDRSPWEKDSLEWEKDSPEDQIAPTAQVDVSKLPIVKSDPIETLLVSASLTTRTLELQFPVVGGFVFVTATFRKTDEIGGAE